MDIYRDRGLSETLYERVRGLGECQCYHVAWAVLMLPDMNEADYVEGSVTFLRGYPLDGFWEGRGFEHAWLILGNVLIDPTWYMYKLTYYLHKRVSRAVAIQAYQDHDGKFPLFLDSPILH